VLAGKTVILGVSGGIAVHYVPELIGVLRQRHMVAVRVVMTEAATRFIAPLTFETASGNPVAVGLFEAAGRWPVAHTNLARLADIVLVAPATANTIGKVACGLADNLLTAIIMATRAPVAFAPAMNPQMWANPIVQGNIGRLRELGYHFFEPRVGVLATGEQGMGCMAQVNVIVTRLIEVARELPTEVENRQREV
jgi:phosphopantothenoylcysteine decarboxylase/phosphopantothenate--cysteine ligase